MLPHNPIGNWCVVQEVLIDDALASFGSDVPVPDPLGINDHPRPAGTNPEAGRLGAHRRDAKGLQLSLEQFPGRQPISGLTAIRSDTQKDVTRAGLKPHFRKAGIDGGLFGHVTALT